MRETIVRESLLKRTDRADPRSDIADAALAAAGDGRAFERLYCAHVDRINALVCRMMGLEEADDVTQEVFIRAWQKLDSFRGDAAFGTWLYRLAVNVILSRRQGRATDRERFHAPGDAIESAVAVVESVPDTIDFERAVMGLPAGARQVFVLHDVEGFKHREIAAMLGISAGTSKAQLHRARMTLRAVLER